MDKLAPTSAYPRQKPRADGFIVLREHQSDYVAFGAGPFDLVGYTLAEQAAGRLLSALAYRCTGLALSGVPERLLDTPGRPWVSLLLKVTLDGRRRRRPVAAFKIARPARARGGDTLGTSRGGLV